jgi:Tfp pilus assembly protein PilZ
MHNYTSPSEPAPNVEARRDARKRFNEIQPIVAACQTMDSDFEAYITDVSSSGVFIRTSRPLLAGQEIAMTFIFPKTHKPIMATGEIVRVSYGGAGVKFKIFFKQ